MSDSQQEKFIYYSSFLTANDSVIKVYLGRPWRSNASVLFMHCQMGRHIVPEGWHNWGKPEREFTVRYAEYDNTGPGSDIKNRVDWSVQLSEKESKYYSLKNVFPGWNPLK